MDWIAAVGAHVGDAELAPADFRDARIGAEWAAKPQAALLLDELLSWTVLDDRSGDDMVAGQDIDADLTLIVEKARLVKNELRGSGEGVGVGAVKGEAAEGYVLLETKGARRADRIAERRRRIFADGRAIRPCS